MATIHITKGSGKMDGIYSVNTSTLENKFCQAMSKTSDVCASCYAERYEKMRKGLHEALVRNDKVFKSKDFKPETLPFTFVRFHSFGELHNFQHLLNVVALVKHNPNTTFTLYTKRANYIQKFLKENDCFPSNLLLIYSNPSLNNERKTPPKGFHKVFNVFTKKYAQKHNIQINCGGKSCMSCMVCYTWNNTVVVNELKK